MYYWKLFIILNIENETNKKEYIDILSFNEIKTCEKSIINEGLIHFKHFKGVLKCLKNR